MESSTGKPIWEPVTVTFGTKPDLVQIIDAATALGYLFSIVKPPKGIDVNWKQYWLPLLALFSRCLYLAFVDLRPDLDMDLAISFVPTMACVMYASQEFGTNDLEKPLMFGASTPYAAFKDFEDQDLESRKERARTWRRTNVLVADLHLQSSACLPLSSKVIPDLERHLHLSVLGEKFLNNPRPLPLHEGLDTLANQIKDRLLAEHKPCKARPLLSLLTSQPTQSSLQSLLRRVIKRRYALTFGPENDAALIQAFKDTLSYYITPHILPFGAGLRGTTQEIPLTPRDRSTISDIVDELWDDNHVRTSAFTKLQNVIDQHQKHDQPALGAYGKCAETYPMVGVG